jgi:hypothetical protein
VNDNYENITIEHIFQEILSRIGIQIYLGRLLLFKEKTSKHRWEPKDNNGALSNKIILAKKNG